MFLQQHLLSVRALCPNRALIKRSPTLVLQQPYDACNAVAKDHTSNLMHTDCQTTGLDSCWAEGIRNLAWQAESDGGCVEMFKLRLKTSSLLQAADVEGLSLRCEGSCRLPFQWRGGT